MLLAVLHLGLLDLDHDIRDGGPVRVIDHDISALGGISAKRDGVFNGKLRHWIVVLCREPVQPKLANNFLRFGYNILLAYDAFDYVAPAFIAAHESRQPFAFLQAQGVCEGLIVNNFQCPH